MAKLNSKRGGKKLPREAQSSLRKEEDSTTTVEESITVEETATEVIFGLEFDGASKGNPGKAGAGALLKHPDGSVICELTKGVGVTTCNFAEYQALIIGLQAALDQGIYHIEAQGDSKLVCKQVMGQWKLRSENLAASFAEVMELKKKFHYFSIKHVYREFNSAADKLANAATWLPENKLVSRFTTFASLSKIKIEESDAKLQLEQLLNDPCSSTFSSADTKIVFCQLAYHGASKGNPGKAGAGAVVSCPDGSMHLHIKQGLGISTRNYAHYQALVIGLQAALDHNISHIRIQGDAVLVYKQMTQQMKVKDVNLVAIWKEANALLNRFTEHSINHVEKNENSEACILAGSAVLLPEDHIIRANLSNGSPTCDSPTAKIQSSTQKIYLNGMKISMESSSECNNNIPRATQILGKCIPLQCILHPKYSQQTSRIVVPRPSNSLFSVSMSKCLPLYSPNRSMHLPTHLGHCTKWKNLPHFVCRFMLRIVEVAPIAISTATSFR